MSSVMSALTGGVSGNSGAAGMNFQADQANIMQPVTQAQIDSSVLQTANQQGQQQQLLQALQSQNGISNQSSVYNQLQGVANGTGPNPAAAQLNQATSANTANQAALMAGQRGAGQNVGLIARQAAQQGAANQQQSAGQAASMQAQQSLGAMGQLGSLATQQVGQQMGQQAQNVGTQQAQQGQLLGAVANYNSAQAGSQASVNSSNANVAAGVAGDQAKTVGSITGAGAGGITSMLAKGGEVRKPMADGGSPSPFDSSISGTSTAPSAGTGAPTVANSGINSPTGPASRLGQYMQSNYGTATQQAKQGGPSQQQSPFAQGYQTGQKLGNSVKKWFNSTSAPQPAVGGSNSSDYTDTTGQSGNQASDYTNDTMGSGQTQAGMVDSGASEAGGAADAGDAADAAGAAGDAADAAAGAGGDLLALVANGGQAKRKVPALLSPGERYLSPNAVKKVEKGANPMKEGKKVPGTPKVKGAKNSYANDTVKATLDEGGIVLPRSVTQHKHPDWAAHQFVRGVMAKNRQGLKK